jgi:hypothetical protein
VPTTVAALQVAVGADISGAEKGLSTLNKRLGTLPGFFGNAASSALGFGAATIGLNALGGVGDLVHQALGVGLASDLEGLTAQFTAFTGSGEKPARSWRPCAKRRTPRRSAFRSWPGGRRPPAGREAERHGAV